MSFQLIHEFRLSQGEESNCIKKCFLMRPMMMTVTSTSGGILMPGVVPNCLKKARQNQHNILLLKRQQRWLVVSIRKPCQAQALLSVAALLAATRVIRLFLASKLISCHLQAEHLDITWRSKMQHALKKSIRSSKV